MKITRLILLVLIISNASCKTSKQNSSDPITYTYVFEYFKYFNLVKSPIADVKPRNYTYEFDITKQKELYIVKTKNNVFDFFSSLQKYNLNWDFESKEISFSFSKNEEGDLFIIDKMDVISQIRDNIYELKKTTDAIHGEVIESLEYYLENEKSLDSYLLNDLELICTNAYHDFVPNQTTVNFREDGILRSIDIDSLELDLENLPDQGIGGVYFDYRRKLDNIEVFKRLSITDPFGYTNQKSPKLSDYVNNLIEGDLDVMKLKSGTFRFTEISYDSNNFLLEYKLRKNQDTNFIDVKEIIHIIRQ